VVASTGGRRGAALCRRIVWRVGHVVGAATRRRRRRSDNRPTDDEFRESFAATRLNASRILRFVEERQHCVQRLVLINSEGYYSGAGPALHGRRPARAGPRQPQRLSGLPGRGATGRSACDAHHFVAQPHAPQCLANT